MRKNILSAGYLSGIDAAKDMRKNGVPYAKIQKELFSDERQAKEYIMSKFQIKCYDTGRTFMRWWMRAFEKGVADFCFENR